MRKGASCVSTAGAVAGNGNAACYVALLCNAAPPVEAEKEVWHKGKFRENDIKMASLQCGQHQ